MKELERLSRTTVAQNMGGQHKGKRVRWGIDCLCARPQRPACIGMLTGAEGRASASISHSDRRNRAPGYQLLTTDLCLGDYRRFIVGHNPSVCRKVNLKGYYQPFFY